MTLEETGWGSTNNGCQDFNTDQYVVELEDQATPEGVSRQLAEVQKKKNKVIKELFNATRSIDYEKALIKIIKARALQNAEGTVKDKEASADLSVEEEIKSLAKLKGIVKSFGLLVDNLDSSQVALNGQLKSMVIQNNLVKE